MAVGGQDGVWAPQRRRLTVGLVLTVILVAFEALSVATVLPQIRRDLGDVRLYGWVFSAFLLASLIGIALAGGLADRVALRGPLLGGLALFAVGLVVGGLAPDMPVLVVGRAVQGLGAGAVPASAYVAIGRAYPDQVRPRMFAVLSTAWVVPGLVGPVLAALVATTVGWRWVFVGLLPLVAVAAVLAGPGLATVPRPDPGSAPSLPLVPAFGTAAGAGVVLTGVTSASPLWAVLGALGGGALLAVSVRQLTPPRTLRAGRGLPATVLSRGALTFCFFAGDAYVPFAVATVRHGGLGLAGAALTASTVAWTAGSWLQERRIAAWGPRRLVTGGVALVLAGLALMASTLLASVPVGIAVVAWGVAGLGMGCAYAPHSVTVLDRAPAGGEGRATAGLQLTDVLGQALGTGLAGAAVALGGTVLTERAGAALAFAIAGVGALGALALSRRLPDRLVGGAGVARVDTDLPVT